MKVRHLLILTCALALLPGCVQQQIQQRQDAMAQARADYRSREHARVCRELQQEFNAWQNALSTVVRAEYRRVPEIDMMGDDATPIDPVSLSRPEVAELVDILRQGQPVPPPSAETITPRGSEPLVYNEHFEIVERAKNPSIACPIDFTLDWLDLYDTSGTSIQPPLRAWGSVGRLADAERYRERWGGPAAARPFILLPEEAWQRFINQPAREQFRARVNKGNRPDDIRIPKNHTP